MTLCKFEKLDVSIEISHYIVILKISIFPSRINGNFVNMDSLQKCFIRLKSIKRCEDKVNDYVCDCLPGFTDKNCSTNIDECITNNQPCQHGATCTDLVNISYHYFFFLSLFYDIHDEKRS